MSKWDMDMDLPPNSMFQDRAEPQSKLAFVSFGWIYIQVIYTVGKKKKLVPVLKTELPTER